MLSKNFKAVAVLLLLVIFVAGCVQQQVAEDTSSVDETEQITEDLESADSDLEEFESLEDEFAIEDIDLEVGL